MGLDGGQANHFRKRPDSKCFLPWPYGLCCSYSTLSLESESSHRHHVNELKGQHASKTLFVTTEIWLSYHSYVSRNILLFIFSLKCLNVGKPFWAPGLYKDRRWVGWACESQSAHTWSRSETFGTNCYRASVHTCPPVSRSPLFCSLKRPLRRQSLHDSTSTRYLK